MFIYIRLIMTNINMKKYFYYFNYLLQIILYILNGDRTQRWRDPYS